MKLVSLSIQPLPKAVFMPVASLCLTADGIAGDCHCGDTDRQVSFLTAADAEVCEALRPGRPCLEKLRCNFQIEGADSRTIRTGQRIRCGEAELLVTKKGRRCHNICDLAANGGQCPPVGGLLFARVLREGVVHDGDDVEVL